jgi:hypothetical protein
MNEVEANMNAGRICLIIAFVLLLIASLLSFGVVKDGPSYVGLALLGFGFWALSGAV